LLGSPDAWHELDIDGAIHIILDEQSRQPVGALIAQHNHHRTFVVGLDFEWPDDDRLPVAFAAISNEPYLLRTSDPAERSERSIGDPRALAYLVGREKHQPLNGGLDRVVSPKGGAEEIETSLTLLPHDDPLYTSWMPLGARRKALGLVELFYFSGPLGIDYYTIGGLKKLANLSAYSYIDPADDEFFRPKDRHFVSFEQADFEPILQHQTQTSLRCAQRKASSFRRQGTKGGVGVAGLCETLQITFRWRVA